MVYTVSETYNEDFLTFLRLGRLGGLGNQLFQYAALMGVGAACCIPIRVPKLWHDAVSKYLRISAETITDQERRRVSNRYRSTGRAYDPRVFSLSGTVDLLGYFQSERYFDFIRSRVVNDFQFTAGLKSSIAGALQALRAREQPIVALSVRRGDYVTVPHNQSKFIDLTETPYYERAMKYFESLSPIYAIFSDDMQWSERWLHGGNVWHATGLSPFQQLALMSECDHAIIANSTFAWWAAWLMKRDAVVVCPSQWFRETSMHLDDLLPRRWLRVDVETVPEKRQWEP